MAGAESAIKEIALALKDRFDQIEKYPGSVTSKQCEELRRQVSLIDYYIRYGGRGGWEVPVMPPSEISMLCSVDKCGKHETIYLIDGIPFCLAHIPTIMGFPIGLHGDDFKAYQARKT